LKVWNTKPMLCIRSTARSSADNCPTSRLSSQYSPPVGRSRHPRMFIRVVLPDPEAPIRATNSPGSTVNETPWSAGMAISPA
jgi:hypothetical protein